MTKTDPHTILIFDDDEDILSICSYILEEEGYKVVSYADAHEIESRVKATKPSLIFMDNTIPGGGVTATQLLKADEVLKNIPVIYFSAHSDIDTLSKDARADAFLSKPFDLGNLIELVRSFVGE